MIKEQIWGPAVQEYAFDIKRLADVCRDNAVALWLLRLDGSRRRYAESDIDLLVNLRNARACSISCGWSENCPRSSAARSIS